MKKSELLRKAADQFLWDGKDPDDMVLKNKSRFLCLAINLAYSGEAGGTPRNNLPGTPSYDLKRWVEDTLEGDYTVTNWLMKRVPEARSYFAGYGVTHCVEEASMGLREVWVPMQAYRKAWAEALIKELEEQGE